MREGGRCAGPVLANLLIQARKADCLVTATDQSVGIRLRVPAEVEASGQALVPAHQLIAILREAPDEQLTLLSDSVSGRVRVEGTASVFELRGGNPASFPSLPSCPGRTFGTIPAEPLGRAVQRTVFAAGKEASRFSRRGVLWEFEPGKVRLVATDNRRLAVAEVPAGGLAGEAAPHATIVPAGAMDLLERLAAEAQDIRALFTERHAFFRATGAALCARLLAGRFPPWRQVLPGAPRYRLELSVDDFLAGVKQAAVLRDRPEARLLLRFQGSGVTLWSRQAGTGRARVEQARALPGVGEPVEVAFNPAYLVELLRALEGEETVRVELQDAEAPALFAVGEEYRHLLMPLRPG